MSTCSRNFCTSILSCCLLYTSCNSADIDSSSFICLSSCIGPTILLSAENLYNFNLLFAPSVLPTKYEIIKKQLEIQRKRKNHFRPSTAQSSPTGPHALFPCQRRFPSPRALFPSPSVQWGRSVGASLLHPRAPFPSMPRGLASSAR